jgi:hypothetical protein
LVEIPCRNLDTRSNHARDPASRLGFVPLEGHWTRVNTPLRETTPREKLLVRGVLAVLAVAALATVVVAISTSGSGTSGRALAPGCIRIEVPSTMGASASDLCGDKAASFCRGPAAHKPPLNATVPSKCRDAGFATE